MGRGKYKKDDLLIHIISGRILKVQQYQPSNYYSKEEYQCLSLSTGVSSWYSEDEVILYNYGNIKKCPTCGTNLTITKFHVSIWKDCSKCKKTLENIIKDQGI